MTRSKTAPKRKSGRPSSPKVAAHKVIGLPRLASTPLPSSTNAFPEPALPGRSNQLQSNRSSSVRQQANQNANEPQPSTSRAGLPPATARPSDSVGRKRRFRSGTKALMEIRKYQKSTQLLLQKLPFSRVVRDIAMECLEDRNLERFLWQPSAIACLQEASEAFLVYVFEKLQICAIHAKRVTVLPRDMWLLKRLGFL